MKTTVSLMDSDGDAPINWVLLNKQYLIGAFHTAHFSIGNNGDARELTIQPKKKGRNELAVYCFGTGIFVSTQKITANTKKKTSKP